MSYKKYQSVDAAPPWLQRPKGKAFLEAFGELKDEVVDRAKESVKARFIGLAPDDSLGVHGADSQIDQGPSEAADAFRARLLDRWNHHTWRGLEKGLEDALTVHGIADVRMYTRRDSTPFDDNTHWWSRWWLFAYQHSWAQLFAADDVLAGDEVVCGTTMTYSELRTIRRICHKTRSGHELGVYLLLIYDDTVVAGPETIADDALRQIDDPAVCALPLGRIVGQCGAAIASEHTICGYYFE